MSGSLLVLAASDPGSKIGENIQNLLQNFAAPVFLGVLGVMALSLMGYRKIGQLATVACVALFVGILIFNSDGVAKMITSIGDAITKGV